MSNLTVWDSKIHAPEQALSLPKGRCGADFGLLIEQAVNSDYVLEAAQSLVDAGLDVKASTQAKIMVIAQEKGLAFTHWASRIVLM